MNVPHRFIVLRMCDNRVHRFDRGPARGPDNDINMVGLLANRDVQSEDSCTIDIPPDALNKIAQKSERELELVLNGQVDILTVIAACYAMSTDSSTCNYSLRKHNCFFFSWAILMVVSRHHLPYQIPQYDSIVRLFQPQLERLASFIVDKVIELLPNLVIDAVGIFRAKADESSRKGMHMLERTVWTLPIGVIGFCYQQFFTIQLFLGLRRQLTESVKTQLSEKWRAIHEVICSTPTLQDRIDACLWLEEAKDPTQNALKMETEKIFWGTILEAISSSLSDTDPEQFADSHRKFSLCDVWNAALYGGLLGAKGAVQGLGEQVSHREAFRRAWFAAGDKALVAAQAAAEQNIASSNKSKRREMWDSNWRVWDQCWEEIHEVVQPRAVEAAEKIIKELSATGAAIVIEGMEASDNKTVEVRVAKVGCCAT